MEVDEPRMAEAEALPHTGPSTGRDRLILPEWDVPPLKPLHASHDFLTLLNLVPLYDTYLRPYLDPADEHSSHLAGADGEEQDLADPAVEGGSHPAANGDVVPAPLRKAKGKRKKLEKGYWPVLLEDIIDPLPMGEGNKSHRSLIPLLGDWGGRPAGGAPGSAGVGDGSRDVWEGEIEILDRRLLEVGTLEVGSKVDGYAGGQKHGVKEAEDRRRGRQRGSSRAVTKLQRKKQRHSLSLSNIHTALSGDGGGDDMPLSTGASGAGGTEPHTPLAPVAPPTRPPFHIRNSSLGASTGTPGPSGLPPKPTFGGVPRASGGAPLTPMSGLVRKRPLDAPGSAGPLGGAKRSKGGSSRSASPMIPTSASASASGGASAVPMGSGEKRLGVPKHSARARTEG